VAVTKASADRSEDKAGAHGGGERPCAEVSAREATYLLALLELSRRPEPPTQAALARAVGVSPPSALEMIRRLRQLGLVAPKQVALTYEGTSAALVLAARRQAAHLLSRDLGLDEQQASAEAQRLAPGISPAIARRVLAKHPRGA
jgi:Mn-dependent DtxR family transcriptional regulator